MKQTLSMAELDAQMAVELPTRDLMARAVGAGGLVGIGIAIDNINVPINVDVSNNNICVGVAAVVAAVSCEQSQ